MKKRVLAVLTALTVMLVSSASVSFGAEDGRSAVSIRESKAKTESYMLNKVKTPAFGNEWSIIGLARSGEKASAAYFGTYYKNLEKQVKACKGKLSERKYTEYSRTVLAAAALGKDPKNIGGYNLLKKLADFDRIKAQGVNGAVWALTALDSRNYAVPKDSSVSSQTTRDKLIAEILRREIPGGGFNLDENAEKPDPDMTAMALQALIKYRDRPAVDEAVERGVEALGNLQNDDGTFASMGTVNCESSAQVVAALSALGIDAAKDEKFVRNGVSALDGMMRFYDKNGGFRHVISTADGYKPTVNLIAAEQGYCALAAYDRMKNGKTSLYDMTDIKPVTAPAKAAVVSLKSPASKSFTVKWKKVTSAKGYQVRYGTSSKFTGSKSVTVSSGSTVTKTVKNLKKGKTYYVKVRAYKTDRTGSKIYGSYSSVKKVKVK